MTAFLLKLIAMGSMVIDHTAFWLVNNNLIMRNIGRLAFVIYAFLIAESYYHLKDKPERLRSHTFKLAILCVISEPLFDQYEYLKWYDPSSQSVMPTLTLGFIALIAIGRWNSRQIMRKLVAVTGSIIIAISLAVVSFFLKSDYAFSGVLLVILFYMYLLKVDGMGLPHRLAVLLLIDMAFFVFDVWRRVGFGDWLAFKEKAISISRWKCGLAVSIIPLVFYNRKLGYNRKWFGWLYSLFYPLQYIVLIIARYFIRGF